MSAADRVLLELAAKAAGIKGRFDYDEEVGDGLWINGERTPDNDKYWNSLAKDGDALRLAARLRISTSYDTDLDAECETTHFAVASAGSGPLGFPLLRIEVLIEDEDAISEATRLAITRVAAEIGKAMP